MADLVEVTPVVYGLTESDITDNTEEEERLKQTMKVSTILFTLFFFCFQINVGFQGWNSQNGYQNSKQGHPDQTDSGSALFV